MRKIALVLFFSIMCFIFLGNMLYKTNNTGAIMFDIERVINVDTSVSSTAFDINHINMAPHSIQVYYYTKYYCAVYNVPETVAFNVARLETGYKNPLDFKYRPNLTSYANAYGTYQLILGTAKFMYEGKKSDITPQVLLTDVKLNVRLGIKYLRYLHDIYNNWTIVCGAYNTGRPIINSYAISATKYI